MKLGRYFIVLIVLVLSLIALGNRGILDNYMMGKRLQTLKQTNREIALKNNQLKAKIMLLRNDPSYIETIARNELGMVKEGDIVYRTVR
ncbi:MAG: septum formation initiator family protein [Deltaproteobacteria bacterium]|nr:septum formation initiator family protein [Deltaproteobacteria bacterium]